MREIPAEMQPRDAVFVHGAGGGAWEWQIWRRVFTAYGWRCRVPDLRPVAAGLAATQFDDYVTQVEAVVRSSTTRHANASGAVLIGASLGGLLAIAACARAMPAALVLINALPPAGVALGSPREYAQIVPWGSRCSLASTMRAMPDGDDAARLYAFRHWRDESGAVLRAAQAGIALAKPACPTLLLASECDKDVPLATSRDLAAFLGAELRVIPGSSHVDPLLGRGAAACADSVRRWLADRR